MGFELGAQRWEFTALNAALLKLLPVQVLVNGNYLNLDKLGDNCCEKKITNRLKSFGAKI